MVMVAGVAVGAMLAVLVWTSAPVVVTSLVVLWIGAAVAARWWRALGLAMICGLYAAWSAHQALGTQVSGPVSARVTGCVVSAVTLHDARIRFSILTTRVDAQFVRRRLVVSAYQGTHVPREGGCFIWQLKVRPPRALLNHTGDDAERRAFVRGIDGYAVVDQAVAIVPAGSRWQQWSLQQRLALARRIRFLAGESAPWSLYVALSIGERWAVPEAWRRGMRDTGTAHLMAISGLHVGLLAGFGLGFGRWVGVPLLRALGLGRWSALAPWSGALLCATGYAALAGFALPTVRALVMLWVFGLAALRRRHISVGDGLALALLLVVAGSPRALLDAGLWLSFGAVAALLTLRLQLRERAWLAQWVAFVGLLPAVAVFIGKVSWMSPLANAVCVPIFALCVVPLTLLAAALTWLAPELAGPMYTFTGWVVTWQMDWLAGLAAWPGAGFSVPDWSLWHLTLASVAVTILLLGCGGLRVRMIAACACLPLLFARAPAPAYGQFVVDVLDVGQAMSVVVRTRSRTLIYDAGAKWMRGDAATRIVVPHLRALGVNAVQTIVISHADMDHRGGAASLRLAYPDARWWSGEAAQLGTSVQPCTNSVSWRWDGVHFSFVHPTSRHPWHGNNASCVLLIEGRHGRALLTGDLEALGELSIVHEGRLPNVDLVVGQHHGSATSSSAAFVQATQPAVVVFATGYANRWSLPRETVQQRWRSVGSEVRHTAADGGVRCMFGGALEPPELVSARARREALWRSRVRP